MRKIIVILILLFSGNYLIAQNKLQLNEIVSKAENKLRGKSSVATMKITTVRPKYTREMQLKSWTQNDDFSLMYIASPARDKGTVYLKRDKEIWYYLI